MINLLSSGVLFFSVLGLTIVESRYWKNSFTPFTVTAWPLAIISILVNLVAVRISFLPVTARVNFFLLLNVFIIWVVGFLIFHSCRKPLEKPNYIVFFSKYKDFRYFLLIVSWIIIFATFFKFYSILSKKGLIFISTGEFENMMISGFTSHLALMGMVLLILLALSLWNSEKTLLDYLTMIFLGLSIVVFMVKYPIIWTVLTIFFIKNLNSPFKLQIRKIISIAGFVVAVFILNLLIMYSGWGNFSVTDQTMWERILGWLYNYLFSGPILLDRWINLANSKPWWSLFIVPNNFINVVMGDPDRLKAVHYVSPGFMHVSSDFISNVGTSFGVYYLMGGFGFTILTTIIIGLLSYYSYLKSFTSPNPITIYFAVIFLIMGTLSFFGQFFTLLTVYEMTFFYVLFIGVFELMLKLKNTL